MSFLLQRIEALSISQSRAPVLNKIAQRRLAARLIAAWGHGELPLKRAGQMALIGKAGHEGGIGGGVTFGEQAARQAQAGLYQISVRRDAGFASEAADQLKAAETAESSKLLERDFLFGGIIEILPCQRDGGGTAFIRPPCAEMVSAHPHQAEQ